MLRFCNEVHLHDHTREKIDPDSTLDHWNQYRFPLSFLGYVYIEWWNDWWLWAGISICDLSRVEVQGWARLALAIGNQQNVIICNFAFSPNKLAVIVFVFDCLIFPIVLEIWLLWTLLFIPTIWLCVGVCYHASCHFVCLWLYCLCDWPCGCDYWKLLLLGGWLCVVSVTLVWELLWEPISPMVHPTVSAMYYLGARK